MGNNVKSVDTHGLKMVGLEKASKETVGIDWRSGCYVQISYDRGDGEIMTNFHVSENDWTKYHSKSIITVCNARRHVTMQQIADTIYENVKIAEHYGD
jgi:hypothetical protein